MLILNLLPQVVNDCRERYLLLSCCIWHEILIKGNILVTFTAETQSSQRKLIFFLKPLRHYMIMDINKLSGKIIGAAIEACPPLQTQARRAGAQGPWAWFA